MRHVRVAMAIILWAALAVAAACDHDAGGGMPPPSEWKPPPPKPSKVEGNRRPKSSTARGSASHELGQAEDGEDPHASVDMGGEEEEEEAAGEDEGGDEPEPGPNETVARGQIRAKGDAASAIKPGAVLYVTAVPIDPDSGQPSGNAIAVEKFEVKALPMKFELAGSPFEGDVVISAWTDADGEARTREPGDVQGQVRARLPASSVDLVLDTVIAD